MNSLYPCIVMVCSLRDSIDFRAGRSALLTALKSGRDACDIIALVSTDIKLAKSPKLNFPSCGYDLVH